MWSVSRQLALVALACLSSVDAFTLQHANTMRTGHVRRRNTASVVASAEWLPDAQTAATAAAMAFTAVGTVVAFGTVTVLAGSAEFMLPLSAKLACAEEEAAEQMLHPPENPLELERKARNI